MFYTKKEDLIDHLKLINKQLVFNFLLISIMLFTSGLMITIFTLAISESFSTLLTFNSGWQLALGNILLSLLVLISLPVYFFSKWIKVRKTAIDYSKIDEYVSSFKNGEMVLLSTFVDKAKSLGLLVVALRPRLVVGLFIWIFALIAVNYLNTTIAMRLLKGYSWGPRPAARAQQSQPRPQQTTTTSPAPVETGNAENIISRSPAGKYWLRFGQRSGVYDPLELVTPEKSIELSYNGKPIVLPVKNKIDFTNKNIVWKDGETAFAFTYFTDIEATPRSPGYLAIFSTSGDLIKMVNLGNASYYGNNIERPFYPVISPDSKYIAVATDLIHQISVFDFMGNKIKDLPTKYSSVELFSPEMYELEGGKYSPFLEYKWSEDGKAILYRFEGTEKYFEVKL